MLVEAQEALLIRAELVDEDLVEPRSGERGDEVEVPLGFRAEGDVLHDIVGRRQAQDLSEVSGMGQLGERGAPQRGARPPPDGGFPGLLLGGRPTRGSGRPEASRLRPSLRRPRRGRADVTTPKEPSPSRPARRALSVDDPATTTGGGDDGSVNSWASRPRSGATVIDALTAP